MVELLGVEVLAVGEEFGYLPAHQVALEKCKKAGIEVCFIPRLKGVSTTELKERILTLKQ
jgi:hypothetical protein